MIRLVPQINLMTTPDERKAADRAENAEAEAKGLRCPKCGCRRARLLDTRSLRRRRECEHCGCRYITVETVFAVVQQRNTTGRIPPVADEEFDGAR